MVTVPAYQPAFSPVAIWCCRCQRPKPLAATNCSGIAKRKSSIVPVPVMGTNETNETIMDEGSSQEKAESCGHRTCEMCEWITSEAIGTYTIDRTK